MSAATSVFDVEIDATDGAAAIDLELRLSHLTAATIGCGSDWIVEVPGPVNLEEIEAVVRDWLDDLGQPSTTIRAAGRILRVERHHHNRRPNRAPYHSFIG
jgi:hypothetical protein